MKTEQWSTDGVDDVEKSTHDWCSTSDDGIPDSR